MMMSTPFAFHLGLVENSVRVTVDGDGIRVAFSKYLQREPPEPVVRLWHGDTSVMGPTLPQSFPP